MWRQWLNILFIIAVTIMHKLKGPQIMNPNIPSACPDAPSVFYFQISQLLDLKKIIK